MPVPREVREGDPGSQGGGQRKRPGLDCPGEQVSRRTLNRGHDSVGSSWGRDGCDAFIVVQLEASGSKWELY